MQVYLLLMLKAYYNAHNLIHATTSKFSNALIIVAPVIKNIEQHSNTLYFVGHVVNLAL